MLFFSKASLDPLQLLTQQLFPLIPWLISLGAISIFLTYLKKRFLPKIKGAVGEWAVNRALLNGLNTAEYHVLHDLLLPDGKGGQTQIDHVVVSAFGIFVIETKNWDCWVFGSEDSHKWTLIYPGGSKQSTLNPLHQNEGHVKAIITLLNVRREHCHNLVFINPVSKLKKGPITGVFQRGLDSHISSFPVRVFDPAWVQLAVDQLMAASMSDDKQAVAAHLAQVKLRQERRYA
jgi:nuclease-like protein